MSDSNLQDMNTIVEPWGTTNGELVNVNELLARIGERLVVLPAINSSRSGLFEKREEVQYLTFRCGTITCGIEGSHVGEVVQQPRITFVPGLPDWVLGVTNLHGSIVSVVDLGRFLQITDGTQRLAMMFITKAENQMIGLMVDSIYQLNSFAVASIFSPPFRVDVEMVAYLRGAVDHEGQIVRLLDCERLLLSSQMQQFS